MTQAEVEAMVRRYLARVLRRYAPVVVGAAALLLVVVTVPTVSPKDTGFQSLSPSGSVSGSQTQASGRGTDTTLAGDVAAGTTGGAPAAGSTVRASSPSGGSGKITFTAPAAAGSAGVTRSGVQCGPGVLQVTWSVYAPVCEPAYKGNNGGATSFGVTGDTITVAFRRTNSPEEKAAFAAAGNAAPGSDDQYLADLRAYVDLFNKTYELYGRKVVIKDYTGQGDNLQEDQGQNLQGAQADAATVHDTLKAFMDASQSPTLASTQPYEEALAHEHVVTIGGLGLPKSWFKEFAPYEYSPIIDGTSAASGAISAMCQRAAGMPAVFARDALYQNQKRLFGLIAPNTPEYKIVADQFANGMKACGAPIAKQVAYDINISRFTDEAASIIAQMKTSGVTTVLCACDPIVTIFLSNSAQSQSYGPEWFTTDFGDPIGRENNQEQWAHAITGGGTYPVKQQSEAYKVFKLAAGATAEPQEQYYPIAYYMANYIFGALQRAGPNLNPLTFQQGVFSMPRTARGDVGIWSGGNEAYAPVTETQIGYWDPNATSTFDGQKGGWISCDGGKWFTINDPTSFAPAHTQFHCFGK